MLKLLGWPLVLLKVWLGVLGSNSVWFGIFFSSNPAVARLVVFKASACMSACSSVEGGWSAKGVFLQNLDGAVLLSDEDEC